MDLNLFYSQHQIALIRAKATANEAERNRHLDHAFGIASRIGTYQLAQGAPAGASWRKAAILTDGMVL